MIEKGIIQDQDNFAICTGTIKFNNLFLKFQQFFDNNCHLPLFIQHQQEADIPWYTILD